MVPRTVRHALAFVLGVVALVSALRHGPCSFSPLPEPPPTPPASLFLDPNTATREQLEALPGIGPTLARRIVEGRSLAAYRRVDDLRRVRGIGALTLDRLRARLRIGAAGSEVAQEAHADGGGEEVRREVTADEREGVRHLE